MKNLEEQRADLFRCQLSLIVGRIPDFARLALCCVLLLLCMLLEWDGWSRTIHFQCPSQTKKSLPIYCLLQQCVLGVASFNKSVSLHLAIHNTYLLLDCTN